MSLNINHPVYNYYHFSLWLPIAAMVVIYFCWFICYPQRKFNTV